MGTSRLQCPPCWLEIPSTSSLARWSSSPGCTPSVMRHYHWRQLYVAPIPNLSGIRTLLTEHNSPTWPSPSTSVTSALVVLEGCVVPTTSPHILSSPGGPSGVCFLPKLLCHLSLQSPADRVGSVLSRVRTNLSSAGCTDPVYTASLHVALLTTASQQALSLSHGL